MQKFYSSKLLDHIAKHLNENLLTIYNIYLFINACAESNFKPLEWNNLILPRIKQIKLSQAINQYSQLNWPLFAINLSKMDYIDDELINVIINNTQISFDASQSLIVLLRSIEKSFNEKLGNLLKRIIGDDKVLMNVRNESGITVQYVLKVSNEGNELISFEEEELLTNKNSEIIAEDIHLNRNEKL